MTEADIYKTLGLKDPDAFEREAQWDNVRRLASGESGLGVLHKPSEVIVRRTGRTTRVVVKAPAKLFTFTGARTAKKLRLAAKTHHATGCIVRTAREMAFALGLDESRIEETGWQSMGVDFRDHE